MATKAVKEAKALTNDLGRQLDIHPDSQSEIHTPEYLALKAKLDAATDVLLRPQGVR